MKLSHRLLLATLAAAPFAHAAPTERAVDYEAALARAKATGNDIAVFQYGSDWNPCSMAILEKVWSKPAFVSALGDGFILVGIDKPEVVGGRAVYGRCTEVNCGVSGFSDTAIGSTPPMNLEKLAGTEPPASEITGVTTDAGTPFARRADGAWKIDGPAVVPGQDMLTLSLSPKSGGRYLRFDFPTDKAIAGNGPGTAGGYFMLSQLGVKLGSRTLKPAFVSDSGSVEGRNGAEALDGTLADNHGYIPPAGQPATLIVDLGEVVPSGASLTVTLLQNDHPRACHLIASVRAAVIKEKQDARQPLPQLPKSEITAVTSANKLRYTPREDGTHITKFAANPATDTLNLKLRTTRGGQVLRLDFPTDESLPAGGPGRASNGNCAINEVEILKGATRVATEYAWGNYTFGGAQAPFITVDGVADKPAEAWNMNGGQHQRRTLFISLKEPVPAGAELTVKIIAKSQWGQHVPGCVSAALVNDRAMMNDVRAVASAQATQYRNRAFTWAGWGKMPRVSLLDREGRPVAADPAPRATLTPEKLAAELKSFRAKREKRDALQAKANTVQGPARAELLRQSLDALDIGRDPEFGRANGWGGGANGPYEPIHKAIREADPKDESGAVRWLGFSQGCWGAIPWAKQNEWWKPLEGKPEPTEADYASAEACIDRELADPRNRLLDTDHIQHIMKARYDLYIRKLKGDRTNPKILDIQRAIAKVDPNTFWGVGAIGYVGMFKRSDSPFMMYGFDGNFQLKPGADAWTLSDGWMYADHAGPFKFSINYGGGKDALRIRRVAVLDGAKEIASGAPASGEETLDATHRSVVVPFEIKTFRDGAKPVIRIEYEAQPGKPDVAGGFAMEPLLIEE